jgi:hypothetical protein
MENDEITFRLSAFMDDAVPLSDLQERRLMYFYQNLVNKSKDQSKLHSTRMDYSLEVFGYKQAMSALGYEIVKK